MTVGKLERPQYVDGQRLEAVDLRAEQDYHVAVRRLVNRALFGPGIGAGLDVDVKPGDPRTVIVSPGLALDQLGREIVLSEPREVPVVGVPSTAQGVVYGNYLVIAYAERHTASIVVPDVRLSWQQTGPRPGSGQVVLAQVELAQDCTVRRVVHPARPGTGTVPVSICGVRDLDAATPIDLYLTIRRTPPRRAVLMLRAEEFSALHYTELGGHVHACDIPLRQPSTPLRHRHLIPDGQTEPPTGRPTHRHALQIEHGSDAAGVNEDNPADKEWTDAFVQSAGSHAHRFAGTDTLPGLDRDWTHGHPAPDARMLDTGAIDIAAQSAAPYRHLANLQVDISGHSVTAAILETLQARDGTGWATLGDGTSSHRLATTGTGALDLLNLGVDLGIGEHHVALHVAAGGGRVRYHLYTE